MRLISMIIFVGIVGISIYFILDKAGTPTTTLPDGTKVSPNQMVCDAALMGITKSAESYKTAKNIGSNVDSIKSQIQMQLEKFNKNGCDPKMISHLAIEDIK